jgi:2-(1,2-epoxy-1,2-dihydrophenyl)acetyl-CoA isomerase
MRTLDTGTDAFLGHVADGVAVLTFNRPERRNALNADIFDAIGRLLPRLATDDDVGCILVTGADGAFCAGGDVRGMSERNEGRTAESNMSFEARVEDLRRREEQVSLALWEHPKVTIASIPGACAGAGLSIALACDLRIAAENAVFTTAFARVGFSGDFGGTWFLTQLVGSAKARELYLTADRFDGTEAARLGVVHRAVPDADLEEAAMAWARRFAAGPVVAHRYIKDNLNRAVTADLRTALAGEAANMVRTGMTQDHREAVTAFLEKRDPAFAGR